MAFDRNKVHTLYRKLLGLYPKEFRERLGASMEQTFHDLCKERSEQAGYGFFLLATYAETAVGIIREYLFIPTRGDNMKSILANPTSAAIVSFILTLPIGFLRLILGSNIEGIVAPVEAALSVDGIPTAFGYTIICGGMLLLPVAFALNLQPILKREKPDGERRVYPFNLIVGAIILLMIAATWGALLVEELYCLRGIRCD